MTTNESTQVQTASPTEPPRERMLLTPPTDILESDDGFELRVDLPGADPASIDVTFEQDVLTLRAGVKPVEHEGLEAGLGEFELADYERRFQVTEPVDADKIEASFELGVLRVRVPKARPARLRIQVRTGAS